MTVKSLHVDDIPIVKTLGKCLEFLKMFDSVILIDHNGRVFDFWVLSYAFSRVQMREMFFMCVLAYRFNSKMPKLCSSKEEYLAQHFSKESYNSHNATDDVNMLVKILYQNGMTKLEFVRHSYSADCHFL